MAKRRNVLMGVGGIVAIAGCSSNGSSQDDSENNISVEEVKNQSSEISYDDLMRNHVEYEGEYVHFPSGRISQVQGDEDLFQLSVYVSESQYNWDDLTVVFWSGERFLEDDIIEIWGKFEGLFTYENVLGSENTIPEINAVEIEIVREG